MSGEFLDKLIMAFLSVSMRFREQHHTDSGTPLFSLRLCRAVVKAFGCGSATPW